ncbi:MAG: helix-turn-helix transcriptional regulator [Pseudomonadota bacterium]
MDTLSPAVDKLAISANTFFNGTLCGTSPFDGAPGPGHLHYLQAGTLRALIGEHESVTVTGPCAILVLPAVEHRLEASAADGAMLVCAELGLGAGAANALPLGIPNPLIVPTAKAPGLEATLDTLFDEAAAERQGHLAATNRLMDLLLVLLLRYCLDTHRLQPGLLAGLAHPQLAPSLLAMHSTPAGTWTLESLAGVALMSRARFAAHFKDTVGVPPGEYLTSLRISLAQDALRQGRPLKSVARTVGYANATALARAFKQKTGNSPRAWLAAQAYAVSQRA